MGTDIYNPVELFNTIGNINRRFVRNYCRSFSGYHRDIRDITLTYTQFFAKLFSEPGEIIKVLGFYEEFLREQQSLYNNVLIEKNDSGDEKELFVSPQKGDKRFIAPQWEKYPYFDFIRQNYWLAEQLSSRIIHDVEMGEHLRKKFRFYTKQYTDMFSPSNFLFMNPELIELTIEKNGENLVAGFENLLDDLEKGSITQVDESAFEVGKTLAVSPGNVIYENELIQLIQYSPLTKEVYEIPILIIPPWINKYYILDLRPKNSFVKFMVEQGFTVFIISWKNPSREMGHFKFEDYIEKGALKAIEVTKEISESAKINVLGYCVGGTLLGIAASILETKRNESINTLTFLASMIDFSDIGPIGDVINEAMVNKLEHGELLKDGLLKGDDMEKAFNLIRAKDMIWFYVINNYLKGEAPPPVDVIYWTNDNTNLPVGMYVYYMRHMILENKLSRKNALHLFNTPIDIGKIKVPVYVIGMKEDYISPPATAFTTTELVSGPVEFILGDSGHVMGIANPPSKKKYGYYLDGKLGEGFEEWKKTAKYAEGSWWIPWSDKLKKNSGKLIQAAEDPGNESYKSIEPAPGRYVMEKC